MMKTAALVTAKDEKILLARSRGKSVYYLPGGKLKNDESATYGLIREIREELSVEIAYSSIQFLTEINAQVHNGGQYFQMSCFTAQFPLEPKASAEIESLVYFSENEYLELTERAPAVLSLYRWLADNNAYVQCQINLQMGAQYW